MHWANGKANGKSCVCEEVNPLLSKIVIIENGPFFFFESFMKVNQLLTLNSNDLQEFIAKWITSGGLS